MTRFLWTSKESFGPSPRGEHAMVFDSNRGRVVLFGGNPYVGNALGDTWEWDGDLWTQSSDVGPAPRSDHAMAFDSTRNVVLLFGGSTGANPLEDTWSWDGTDWTQLADIGPSARANHAMAFDPMRGRAVLFGGLAEAGLMNDTWEWDGLQWTQQENLGPSARQGQAMVFDLVGGHTVLFGGTDASGQGLVDTWEWDGALWTHTANFGPSLRLDSAMASSDVQVVLHGGAASSIANPPPVIFHDTWSYASKRWTHRQDIGPGPRYSHAMAFDSARRTLVLFGGLSVFEPPVPAGLVLGDTWEHTETEAPVSPPSQNQASGPTAIAITCFPSSATPAQPVTATVTLDRPAPAGNTVIQLGYVPLSVFQTLQTSPVAPGSPNPVTTIGQVTIMAGATSGQYTFPAPAQQPTLAILASTNWSVTANGRLTIV